MQNVGTRTTGERTLTNGWADDAESLDPNGHDGHGHGRRPHLGGGIAHAAGTPGAPGAGDTYFPDYGNGGYDVDHYDVRLRYQPKTDQLTGTTTILAQSTQELSRFNLDFALDVSSVQVNNRAPASPGKAITSWW